MYLIVAGFLFVFSACGGTNTEDTQEDDNSKVAPKGAAVAQDSANTTQELIIEEAKPVEGGNEGHSH